MEDQILKPGTPEFQEAMAELMSEAVTDPQKMVALAAALAKPISTELIQRYIVPLAFTEKTLPAGEESKYSKRGKARSFFVAQGGAAVSVEPEIEDVILPPFRVFSEQELDVSDLRSGNYGKLVDLQRDATTSLRKQLNSRTVSVLSAAVSDDNTVDQSSGTTLSQDTWNKALGIMQDMELNPKTAFIRGSRYSDFNAWTKISDQMQDEFVRRGVIGTVGGCNLVNTAAMNKLEVIILPDEEIGKFDVKTKLVVEPVNETKRFKRGILVWMEACMGVLDSDKIVKITIPSE